MQTLGISDSTPQSENRLKRLFWPSIQSAGDVDALGMQGYWVCSIVAAVSLFTYSRVGFPITGVCVFLFFYLGGVGVREHSFFAAIVVSALYIVSTVISPGIVGVFLAALLIANLRATWLAADWKRGSSDATMPMRFDETWSDKLVDQFPAWLWPKVRIVYYIYSVSFMLLTFAGYAMTLYRRHI